MRVDQYNQNETNVNKTVEKSLDEKLKAILNSADPMAAKYEYQQEFMLKYEGAVKEMSYDSRGELSIEFSVNQPKNEKLKVFLVNVANAGFKGYKVFNHEIFCTPLKSLDYLVDSVSSDEIQKNRKRLLGKKSEKEIENSNRQIKANNAMKFMSENKDEIALIAEDEVWGLDEKKTYQNKSYTEKMDNFRRLIRAKQLELARKEFEKAKK